MKNIFFKIAQKSAFVGGWSIITAAILIYFCYYGVFPSSET